jgi:hypothetical protein
MKQANTNWAVLHMPGDIGTQKRKREVKQRKIRSQKKDKA